MSQSLPAADDFTFIRSRQKEIEQVENACQRGTCFIRIGKGANNCWCWKAGPNGSNLPCPTQSTD